MQRLRISVPPHHGRMSPRSETAWNVNIIIENVWRLDALANVSGLMSSHSGPNAGDGETISAPGETRLFSTDPKNQLAAKVAGFAYLVRGHGFAELIACYFQG